ncbi:hypothetical protein V8G54_034302 [Vigna mungo]|uniref:Uncharacterized protein n=1 Tax=Vigna mungo TaxID=3915 RepID=A0AAQ3MPG7_VIGMU
MLNPMCWNLLHVLCLSPCSKPQKLQPTSRAPATAPNPNSYNSHPMAPNPWFEPYNTTTKPQQLQPRLSKLLVGDEICRTHLVDDPKFEIFSTGSGGLLLIILAVFAFRRSRKPRTFPRVVLLKSRNSVEHLRPTMPVFVGMNVMTREGNSTSSSNANASISVVSAR